MPPRPRSKKKRVSRKKEEQNRIREYKKRIPDLETLLPPIDDVVKRFVKEENFWNVKEEDAFKVAMNRQSRHACFCTNMSEYAKDEHTVPVSGRGDMLIGFFNRGTVRKKIGLRMWYTVPNEYITDEYTLEPNEVVYLWNGSFPLLLHTTVYAYPTVQLLEGETWDGIYLVQGYLDIQSRWRLFAHSQGFKIEDGFIQFGRGIAFRWSEHDQHMAEFPEIPSIEYPQFGWGCQQINEESLDQEQVNESIESSE